MSLHTIYDQITLIISTIFYGFGEAMDSIWNADLSNAAFGIVLFCFMAGTVLFIFSILEHKYGMESWKKHCEEDQLLFEKLEKEAELRKNLD